VFRRNNQGERNDRRGKIFAALSAIFAVFSLSSAKVSAQSVARYSLETVVEADEFAGDSASSHPQIVIDVSLAVRMGDNWQAYVRPWLRLPRPNAPTAAVPPWDTELYQAAVRYEHRGPIATRFDAGYILSPIGLGLYDVRPGINPTIVPHLSYLQPMPVFDPTAPRVSAVAATYPLGAQLTVSSGHWDARAAVINSAPTRLYALGGPANPRQTPVFVAGGGVTPITGLRLGASFAHGAYATPDEITGPTTEGRGMTMAGVEGEWAFGGTKLAGEWLRTGFETIGDTAVAYEWFLQGQHTLTPRWFVAARTEGTSAPPLINGIAAGTRTDFRVVETTAGFRVNRDVTLRGSYYTRRFYGSTVWVNQVGVSAVWSRRWW
jgi:hypothetical protein